MKSERNWPSMYVGVLAKAGPIAKGRICKLGVK
jgi:hypothetical protein